jgi:hypothetical protein
MSVHELWSKLADKPWRPGMKRLRWCPGFADHLKYEGRVPDGKDIWTDVHPGGNKDTWHVPDFDDDATLGALRGAVRQVYNDPKAYTEPTETGDNWRFFWRDDPTLDAWGCFQAESSEVGCLLAAYQAFDRKILFNPATGDHHAET